MTGTDILIVGAGAAGLTRAMAAAEREHRVRVLDRANKAGKRILMPGGGYYNFASLHTEPANFLSRNPHLYKSALACYTQWDSIGLTAKHQVPYHEKKLDQLLCDDRSSGILEMLLRECVEAGVGILLDTSIEEIVRDDAGYRLRTSAGEMCYESLVIAGDGLSAPTLGTNGFGYQATRQFGHEVLSTRAGLASLTITGRLKKLRAKLSGTSVDCRVNYNSQVFRENLLFTHHGLSGPAMLQISSYWQPGDTLEIDLLPGHGVSGQLVQQQRECLNSELKILLTELFTKKLTRPLVDRQFVFKPMKQYTPTELTGIAGQLLTWRVTSSGTKGHRTAEMALGRVSTDEVSPEAMESQRSPGLYFVDEVLDVSGHLGGFSFQWAWALGYAAERYTQRALAR